MGSKFKLKDKVVIKRRNDRTSKEILDGLRLDHPRTIISIYYDPETQHNRYYLGTNKRGKIDLTIPHFRSSELILWNRGMVGRPKTKRRYTKNSGFDKGFYGQCPPNDAVLGGYKLTDTLYTI